MRFIVAIVIFLIPNVSFGQNIESQKAAIDAELHRISKQSGMTTVNFSIQALKKVLHFISYQYVASQSGYVKISRQFSYKNDTIQQTFYLKDGGLIYSTKKITSYFTEKGKTDSITWSGDFYFAKGKLIDYVTPGHGKPGIDTWNPEQDMLTAFNESKRDIERYKKKKNDD